jgi:hypothetical protein
MTDNFTIAFASILMLVNTGKVYQYIKFSPFLPELCHSLSEKSVSALPHLIAYSIFNEQNLKIYRF